MGEGFIKDLDFPELETLSISKNAEINEILKPYILKALQRAFADGKIYMEVNHTMLLVPEEMRPTEEMLNSPC